MRVLDLDALARTPLQHDPCDFVVVPDFVRSDALALVNRDYPAIAEAGNFEPEDLTYGPSFADLIEELNGPAMRETFAAKFGLDLSPYTLQMTVRKFSEASDGNVHNDSKSKIVTALIYFNEEWPHPGGRLRLVRNPDNIDDFTAEVPPVRGTLIAFRRNEKSYHGFRQCVGERRSLQMYWVKPKRPKGAEKQVGLKKLIKRFLKVRTR